MQGIERANVWETVYRSLVEQITTGKLNPGEKLDEMEISTVLNVSRTPVREALKQLNAEGYITTIPKKGSFVTKQSPKELDEIYGVLAKLEGLGVILAAGKLGENEVDELQKLNLRMKRSWEENNYKKYLEDNVKFHLFFPKMAGNTVLESIINQLKKKTFRYHYFGITLGHIEEYIQDHEQILSALSMNDFELASKSMEHHVDRIRKVLLGFSNSFQ